MTEDTTEIEICVTCGKAIVILAQTKDGEDVAFTITHPAQCRKPQPSGRRCNDYTEIVVV